MLQIPKIKHWSFRASSRNLKRLIPCFNSEKTPRGSLSREWVVAMGSLVLFLAACQTPKGEIADTIYTNAQIITMEGEDDVASSVAVKNGLILAVDKKSLVRKHRGENTKVIDLEGKTLLPGFVDAHSHISMGMSVIGIANLSSPPVGEVKSISDIVGTLKNHQETNNIPEGVWIAGWGYDPDLLDEKRHPNKLDLDETFPNNPVFLLHVSGHMAVVNSKALALVGLDATSPDPPGGMIVRLDESLEPSGLLQETALYIARKALPTPTPEQSMALFEKTQDLYAANGITTAQDGFAGYENYQFLRQAAETGKLKIDIEVLAGFLDLEKYLGNHLEEFGQLKNGLRLTGVKVVSDGSPQGKTAYFSKPYLTDVPGCAHDCRGFPNLTGEQLAGVMKQCYEAGVQLYTHANGDGAIGLFLDTHASVLESMEQVPDDMRNVIIHSQFVRPDQLDQYKKYEMVPAYFTNHAFFWGDTHLRNLGEERANFLSPMKTSMEMGIVCTNHTDFPVTPVDQLFLLNTAVNRTARSGKTIGEDQRLTPYQGLKAITINAAYQHKQEHLKGSIKEGKLADFVILGENPLTIEADKIKDIAVLETIKEGETIYKLED